MTSLRARALTAAIELLGTQGLRALTHRRIDDLAQLPVGSTSNYFRTREALLIGVADSILEREVAGMGATFAPRSVEELADALAALLERTTGEQRTLTTARLVLFLEAGHHPALRKSLGQGRAILESALRQTLEDLGATDAGASTKAVMACAEGLILHRIARHDDSDFKPVLDLVLHAALD